MKFSLLILAAFLTYSGYAGNKEAEFSAGRTYYADGEFKKAVTHFQLALQVDPDNAEACYWTGMAYQRLADISTPFGRRYNSKARQYLTRAAALSPYRSDYRLELFNFLLDTADASHTRPSRATGALLSESETDPEYVDMLRRFHQANKLKFSAGALLATAWLVGPRAAYELAALSTSALSHAFAIEF